MRSRWDLWTLTSALGLLGACGASESDAGDDDANSGRAGGTAGSAGVTSSGGQAGSSAGAGGANAAGQGGAGDAGTSSSAGGSSGSAAGNAPVACLERTTNHTAGSRLRGRFIVTAEGDRNWNGWYDSALDMNCSFIEDTTGTRRCFPEVRVMYGSPAFADENCTEQVAGLGAGDSLDYIVSNVGVTGCSPGINRVFRVGDSVELGGTVYIGSPGSCTAQPAASDVSFHRFGAEVDPTTFVTGRIEQLEGTSRVRSRAILAEDGTIQVIGFDDTELGGACFFEQFEDGVERCAPYQDGMSTGFSDAACTAPALSFVPCDEGAPVRSYTTKGSACGLSVFAVGPPIAGAGFYWGVDAECIGPTADTVPLYENAGPAPASVMLGVTHSRLDADPGRLKPVYRTSDDGGCWFHTFYDTELMSECGFEPEDDGSYRCRPSFTRDVANTLATYSDDACSVEAPLGVASGCASDPLPTFAVVSAGDPDALKYDMWRTGELIPSPETAPYFVLSEGLCVPAMLEAGKRYMTLTSKLEASAFVAGQVQIE